MKCHETIDLETPFKDDIEVSVMRVYNGWIYMFYKKIIFGESLIHTQFVEG